MSGKDWIMVVILVSFALWLGIDIALSGVTRVQRTTCEAFNETAIANLRAKRHLVQINRGRVEAALEEGDRETARANRIAIRKYTADRDDYIASRESFALSPSENSPNGVRYDCTLAWPDQWPGPF